MGIFSEAKARCDQLLKDPALTVQLFASMKSVLTDAMKVCRTVVHSPYPLCVMLDGCVCRCVHCAQQAVTSNVFLWKLTQKLPPKPASPDDDNDDCGDEGHGQHGHSHASAASHGHSHGGQPCGGHGHSHGGHKPAPKPAAPPPPPTPVVQPTLAEAVTVKYKPGFVRYAPLLDFAQ